MDAAGDLGELAPELARSMRAGTAARRVARRPRALG